MYKGLAILRGTLETFQDSWRSIGIPRLSDKAMEYLSSTYSDREEREIPNWDQYFIQMAFLVSRRSKDAQTQHGCVITDQNCRVIGVGYNSFPKGMPDDLLPNIRPAKYDWMVHSERNALANCIIRPDNGIAYVTGQPCNDCAIAMYQEGIRKFVLAKRHGSALLKDRDASVFEVLTKAGDVELVWIKPEVTALVESMREIKKLD